MVMSISQHIHETPDKNVLVLISPSQELLVKAFDAYPKPYSVMVVGAQLPTAYSKPIDTQKTIGFLFIDIYSCDDTESCEVDAIIVRKNAGRVFSNRWALSKLGHVREDFDLQGEALSCVTLSFAPFFKIENCQEGRKNCTTRGIITDIMDEVSKMYNFTWFCDKPPSGNWGHYVSSKIENKTIGVTGLIATNQYEMALSTWMKNEERVAAFDFTIPFLSIEKSAVLNLPGRIDDPLFLIRPFSKLSKLIMVVISILFGCCFATEFILESYSGAWYNRTVGRVFSSQSIAVLSFSICFLLLEIFYGGALTMFLSSSPRLPFKSLEEGLSMTPKWRLLLPHSKIMYY